MNLKEWKKVIQHFAVGALVTLGIVAMPFDFYRYDSYSDFCKIIFVLVVLSYGLVEWIDNKQKGRIRQKRFDDEIRKQKKSN